MVERPRDGAWRYVLDLITSWGAGGGGPVVLRFVDASIRLERLVIEFDPGEDAMAHLATEVATLSKARKLGKANPWPGPPLQRFLNETALERGWYGRSRA